MKTKFSLKFMTAALMAALCCSAPTAHAIVPILTYYWVPTDGTPDLFAGSYIQLILGGGTDVTANYPVFDWSINTPDGNFSGFRNSAAVVSTQNSTLDSVSDLTWNTTTIEGGTITIDSDNTSDVITITSTGIVDSDPGTSTGHWSTSSVPDSSSTFLCLASVLGAFVVCPSIRRRTTV